MAERVKSTLFVVTGNRLRDGRVVYLRPDRSWGPDLDEAWTLTDAAERDALVAWAQPSQRLEITGIYAFDISITESGARVLSTRETLRAQGEVATRRRMGIEG